MTSKWNVLGAEIEAMVKDYRGVIYLSPSTFLRALTIARQALEAVQAAEGKITAANYRARVSAQNEAATELVRAEIEAKSAALALEVEGLRKAFGDILRLQILVRSDANPQAAVDDTCAQICEIIRPALASSSSKGGEG